MIVAHEQALIEISQRPIPADPNAIFPTDDDDE